MSPEELRVGAGDIGHNRHTANLLRNISNARLQVARCTACALPRVAPECPDRRTEHSASDEPRTATVGHMPNAPCANAREHQLTVPLPSRAAPALTLPLAALPPAPIGRGVGSEGFGGPMHVILVVPYPSRSFARTMSRLVKINIYKIYDFIA